MVLPNANVLPNQRGAKIKWVFRASYEVDADDEEPGLRLYGELIDHCSAFAFQVESAPETGYLHYQGCFFLINKKEFTWIQKSIRHFEYLMPQKGSPMQAWAYSSKVETRILGPWYYGECPVEGNRSDLKDFVKACLELKSDSELWIEHPSSMARYGSVSNRIRGLQPPKRTEDLQVIVLYGKPGTGKSRTARNVFPGIYDIPIADKLWLTERAYGQKFILFEDFSGEMPLKKFNRLLDPYPLEIEFKGGYLWYCPHVIVITTNDPPHTWYDYSHRKDVKAQIFRRINFIINFNDKFKKTSCSALEESLIAPQRQVTDALVMPRLGYPGHLPVYSMPERFPHTQFAPPPPHWQPMIPPRAPTSWDAYQSDIHDF